MDGLPILATSLLWLYGECSFLPSLIQLQNRFPFTVNVLEMVNMECKSQYECSCLNVINTTLTSYFVTVNIVLQYWANVLNYSFFLVIFLIGLEQ